MDEEDDAEPPRSGLALAALQLTILVNCMGRAALSLNLPFLLFDIGASPAAVGLVAAANGAASVVGSLLWGTLSDRVGRKVVALPCVVVASALQAAALFTSTPWALAAVTSVYFFFAAGARVVLAVFIADIVDRSKLSFALGLMSSSDGLGTIIGATLSGIYKDCGYLCVANTASGASLVMLAIGCMALPAKQPAADAQEGTAGALLDGVDEEDDEDEGSWLDDYKSSMSIKRFRYIVRLHALINFGYVLTLASMSLICHGLYSYTAVEFGRLSGATGITTAFFQGIFLQRIVNVLRERSCVVLGLSVRLAGSVVIAACVRPWAPALSMFATAIGTCTSDPCLMSMAIVSVPEASRGMAISTYRSASLIGESLGPVVAGFAYTAHPALPFWLSAATTAVAVLGIVWKRKSVKPPSGTSRELQTTNHVMTEAMAKKGKMKRMRTMMMLTDAQMQPSVAGKFPTITPRKVKRMQTQPLLSCESTSPLLEDTPTHSSTRTMMRRSSTTKV